MTPEEEFDAEIEIAEAEAAAKANKPAVSEPKADPGWFEPGSKSGALVQGLGSPTRLADELGGAAAATTAKLSQLTDFLARTAPGRFVARKLTGLDGVSDATIDQITQGASQDARHAVLGGDTPMGAYRGTRDAIRHDDKAAQESHPGLYTGAGVVAGMGLPGAGITKGMSLGQKAVAFGKGGAALGAVAGAGGADGSVVDRLRGALKGGEAGFVTGAVGGPTLHKGGELAGRLMKHLARGSAVRAVTPSAGLTDHLRAEGIKPDDLGDAVLEADILRFGGTTKGTLGRLDRRMDEVGQVIGQSMREADTLATQGGPRVDPVAAKKAMEGALRNATMTGAHVDAADAAQAAIGSKIDLQAVPGPMGRTRLGPTYEGMWSLKSNLQKTLKPIELSNMDQSMYREGVGGLTENLYSQLQGALPPERFSALQKATSTYGPLRVTEKLLNKALTREAARKPLGITDLQKGQIAGQALGGGWGAAAAIGSALVKGRVPSTTAVTTNAMGKHLPGLIGGGQHAGGLPSSAAAGVSRAATKPEPDEEDRNAFVKGNGG